LCGPVLRLVFSKWTAGLKNGYGEVLARLSGKELEEFFPTTEDVLQILGSGPRFAYAPYVIAQDDNLIGRKPIDPIHLVYTGFLHLPAAECTGEAFGGQAVVALDLFMKQCGDNRPVYIGWGSLKGADADWLSRFAARTLKNAGCKGIVLKGWAGLKEELIKGEKDEGELMEYSKKNILWMETAPHEVLFPMCSVIIHHGGIGTTQVALRSGQPSIITPVFYDQFESGDMVTARKVGYATKPLSQVKPEALADMIKTCLADKEIQKRAQELADVLNSRNGVVEFTELTVKFFREQIFTGDYMKAADAVQAKKREQRMPSQSKLFFVVPLAMAAVAATYLSALK